MTADALDEVVRQLRDELVREPIGSIRVRDLRYESAGSGSGDDDVDLRLLALLDSPSEADAGAWPPEDAFALRRWITRWWAARDDTDLPKVAVVLMPATPESQEYDPDIENDLGQAVEGGDDERSDSP